MTDTYITTRDMCANKILVETHNKGGTTAVIIAGQCRSLALNLDNIKQFIEAYSQETSRLCKVFLYLDPHVNYPWQEDAACRKADLCTVRTDIAIRKHIPEAHIHYYNANDIHANVAKRRLNDAAYLCFQSIVEKNALDWALQEAPHCTHVLKLRPDAQYTTDIDMSVFWKYDTMVLKDWDMCFHCTTLHAKTVTSLYETIEKLDLESITKEPVTIHNVHYSHLYLNGLIHHEVKFCTLNRSVPNIATPFSSTNNVYIPIGIQCSATKAIQRAGLRREAFPFDWSFTSLKLVLDVLQGASLSIDSRVVFDSFEHFRTSDNGYYIASTSQETVYPHNNSEDLHSSGCITRRINRLRDRICDASTTKVFVHCTEITHETRYTLNNHFPNADDATHILNLCNHLECSHIRFHILVFDFVGRFKDINHHHVTIVPIVPESMSYSESPFLFEIEKMIAALSKL